MKFTAHPYEGLPVILVSGVGRSGTTALRHSLGVHPDLHSTGTENNIVFDVLETARHNCTFPSRRATMQVAPPAYDRQFRLLLLNLLWPAPRRGSRRPQALLAMSDLLPLRADYFLQLFPGGRVAYLVRNGIEVVASRMTHPYFRGQTFEAHCQAWAQAQAMAAWGEPRPGFALVRHEHLLDAVQARAALETTLAKLGLRVHPSCADDLLATQYHPTRVASETPAAADDLRKRHERWRLWSGAQRETFVKICGEAMAYFGYPLEEVPP